MRRIIVRILLALGSVVGALVLGIGLTLAVWALRPNRAQVDTRIIRETRDLVRDDRHNSNTDFVKLGGRYWLAFVSSPFHFGSTESRFAEFEFSSRQRE